jgi:putative ABC transport system permease protein
VTERTREIGIRLAIGTRGRDVLRQFLIESTVLSVIGGAIGILVGVGAAKLMTYMNNWPTSVTVSSIVAAFLCSAAIGVFFGYYPARQAARLDPIQALRAE